MNANTNRRQFLAMAACSPTLALAAPPRPDGRDTVDRETGERLAELHRCYLRDWTAYLTAYRAVEDLDERAYEMPEGIDRDRLLGHIDAMNEARRRAEGTSHASRAALFNLIIEASGVGDGGLEEWDDPTRPGAAVRFGQRAYLATAIYDLDFDLEGKQPPCPHDVVVFDLADGTQAAPPAVAIAPASPPSRPAALGDVPRVHATAGRALRLDELARRFASLDAEHADLHRQAEASNEAYWEWHGRRGCPEPGESRVCRRPLCFHRWKVSGRKCRQSRSVHGVQQDVYYEITEEVRAALAEAGIEPNEDEAGVTVFGCRPIAIIEAREKAFLFTGSFAFLDAGFSSGWGDTEVVIL